MNKQNSNLVGKIGLEIHVYPITNEKLFCRCKASREKGLKPNINICPICTGQPGAKPMLANKSAVEKAVFIGLMLKCKINNHLKWQRKHYSWPDLPKGYQNTMSGAHAIPVGEGGKFSGIKIGSMHLEEDPASWDPETGGVDYNRSGLPLIEIVTEPDFKTSGEVVNWLKKLVHNLSYLKIVDDNAGIKVDVNVNIQGKTERVEIKNISSIESIGRAIDYEFERQINEGGSSKETRRFDSVKNETMVMRKKEGADDYRFIVDPDLRDVNMDDKFIENIRKKIPETPEEKLEKFIKVYKIDKKDASVLSKNIDIVEFFESVVLKGKKERADIKKITPWITVELLRHLNYNNKRFDELDIKSEHFVSLLNLVFSGKITKQQGKKILDKFIPKSFDPKKELKGNEKISGDVELMGFISEIIKNNKKAVEDFKNGEEKALNFLIGRVMALTKGRADSVIVKELLKKELK